MLKVRSPWTGVVPALAGMLALASSLGVGRFVYTPILPAMIEALGMSRGTAGLIASANFAGYLAGALAVTRPLPGGPRPWFIGGLLVGAATTAAMAAANGVAAFMLLRFAGGASSAFVLVLGTAAVLDLLARSGRPGFRAIHYAGVGLGIAVSAVGVAGLQAVGADWRTEWLAAGLVAAAVLPFPIATLRPAAPAPTRAAERVRIRGRLLALSICHGLFGFGYIVTATFLVAIVRGTAPALEPIVWAVVGLTAIPSSVIWDRLGTRLGPLRAYALAFAIEAAGVLAGGAWPSAYGALLAAVLLGGTFMGLTALGFAAAREMGPVGQARRFAVITTGFGAGQVIGPAAGGAIADWTGNFAAASGLAAAALAVGAVLAFILSRPRVR